MKFEQLVVKMLDGQGFPTVIDKFETGTITFKDGFAFVDYISFYNKESRSVYSGSFWIDFIPREDEKE